VRRVSFMYDSCRTGAAEMQAAAKNILPS